MTDSSNEHIASAEISCHGESNIPAANISMITFAGDDNREVRNLLRMICLMKFRGAATLQDSGGGHST